MHTTHFSLWYVPQYRNKPHHQISIYIAADIIRKAVRRHQIKRKLMPILLAHTATRHPYYKIFLALNKKHYPSMVMNGLDVTQRTAKIDELAVQLNQEIKRLLSLCV
jgi:RNase P protein component